MLEIVEIKKFTHKFCEFYWLNTTDFCCIKQFPENCGWFMDGYLKLMGFVGNTISLQADDTFRTTNDDYNDDNPLENYYNVDISHESDAE